MTTVHSADPPRRFQELARELDVRAPARPARRDARARARRAAAPRSSRRPARGRPGRLATCSGGRRAPRARVVARPRATRRPVRRATPRDDARGGRAPRQRARRTRSSSSSTAPRTRRATAASSSASSRRRRPRRPHGVSAARCSSRVRSSAGAEVLCGMTRDPDFGPILAVGRGGVAVEELDSVALSSAPLDATRRAALVAEAGVDDPHGVVARNPRRTRRSRSREPSNRVGRGQSAASSGRQTRRRRRPRRARGLTRAAHSGSLGWGATSAREVGMTIHPRESRYGRREFLGRSAAGVIGLSSLSTILAACGGGDNGNFKPPELQLATPGEPGHVAAVRRQPDDRVRPRARERDAPHLQLERLPLAEDQEGLRQGVRRQGRGDVLLDDRRGGREDLVRRGRLRRLLPDARTASDDSSSASRSSR